MAKRIITKIGDVFCVEFDNGTKGYFQYIANDLTMMNSTVIRVFKTHYSNNQPVLIEDIIKDDVDFYAHTILRSGIANNAWYKIGTSLDLGIKDFATTYFGYTIPTETIGNKVININPLTNWVIWKYQSEFINIGELPTIYHEKIEFGSIMPYQCIITRMLRGYYTATICEYEILRRKPRPEYKSYVRYKINDIEYLLCFQGDFFEKEIIIEEEKVTKITREEAVINNQDIARRKFSDTNWKYIDFITEEEFNCFWNQE